MTEANTTTDDTTAPAAPVEGRGGSSEGTPPPAPRPEPAGEPAPVAGAPEHSAAPPGLPGSEPHAALTARGDESAPAAPPAEEARAPQPAAPPAHEPTPAEPVAEAPPAPEPQPVTEEARAPEPEPAAPEPAPEAPAPVAEVPAPEPATPEPLAEGEAPAAPEPEATAEAETTAKPKRKPRAAKAKAAEQPAEPAAQPAAEALPAADGQAAPAEPAAESKKKWYVVKVQSGREESIKAAIERKVKIEGLEEYFGQIAIPVEQVTEVKKVKVTDKKTGEKVTQEKRVIKNRKKFAGYIFAEVEFNDRILYLFRETSGVGDFVGATTTRAPAPMTDREVQAMLHGIVHKDDPKKKGGKTIVKLDFEKGDKVRIREGAFSNMEGEVKTIPPDVNENSKVTVVVSIFGRPVDVEVDHWHVDKV